MYFFSVAFSVPENKTRSEGTVDVLFECPFSLPPPLQPTVDGIKVSRVELGDNRTTFQYFAPIGNEL